jgi:hypothetical protein
MATYTAQVIDRTVHEWGPDGQGEYLHSTEGYILGSRDNIFDCIEDISDHFGRKITQDDYYDNYLNICQIEDGEGVIDRNGSYIVDYLVEVTCSQSVNIIEELKWES